MNGDEQLRRWRWQRNALAVAALAMMLGAIGASLPRTLARRDQLKALHAELLQLQASITSVQQRTREVQVEIVRVQDEIRTLLKQP